MSQYQQADPIAAAALVELLGPKFHRYFSGRQGNKSEAEDMLQDFWLRIHQARHSYHPGDALLPWMHAIALGVLVDYYRRRRRIASRGPTCASLNPNPGRSYEQTRVRFASTG